MKYIGPIIVIVIFFAIMWLGFTAKERPAYAQFKGYKVEIVSIKGNDTLFWYYQGQGGHYLEFYSTEDLTKFK